MGISYAGIERYECLPDKNELQQLIRYKEILNKKTASSVYSLNYQTINGVELYQHITYR